MLVVAFPPTAGYSAIAVIFCAKVINIINQVYMPAQAGANIFTGVKHFR